MSFHSNIKCSLTSFTPYSSNLTLLHLAYTSCFTKAQYRNKHRHTNSHLLNILCIFYVQNKLTSRLAAKADEHKEKGCSPPLASKGCTKFLTRDFPLYASWIIEEPPPVMILFLSAVVVGLVGLVSGPQSVCSVLPVNHWFVKFQRTNTKDMSNNWVHSYCLLKKIEKYQNYQTHCVFFQKNIKIIQTWSLYNNFFFL